MPNFRKSKIYQLTGDDPKQVYIGSTTQSLVQRKSEHVYASRHPERDQHESAKLKGPLKISLIERYPTTSRAALEKREGKVIQYMNAKGKKVVNKRLK